MKRAALILMCATLAGAVVGSVLPVRNFYTSTARVRFAGSGGERMDSVLINRVAQQILSRRALTGLVRELRLHEEELARIPLEDVLEGVKKSEVRFQKVAKVGGGALDVSFSYYEPRLAQSAAQRLAGLFLEASRAEWQKMYLDRAGTFQWYAEKVEKQIRQLEANGGGMERRRVEADLGVLEEQYRSLRESRAGALATVELMAHDRGPRLELAQAASFPRRGDVDMALHGACGGVGVGLLLLGIPFLRSISWRQAGVALGCGMTAGVVVYVFLYFGSFHVFRSTAVVRSVPHWLPDELVPWGEADVKEGMEEVERGIPSRASLMDLVNVNGLFGVERVRLAWEAVLGKAEVATEVRQLSAMKATEISFSYAGSSFRHERETAQKVAQEMASRYLRSYDEVRWTQEYTTESFLKRETERAAREWAAALRPGAGERETAAADAEEARQRYVGLQVSLARLELARPKREPPQQPEAIPGPDARGGLRKPVEWSQDGLIELLGPASMPEDTTMLDYWIVGGAGVVGMMVGLFWRRLAER